MIWWLCACLVGTNDVDGDGFSPADGDCNDEDVDVHPHADELCGDGVDNDCDGRIDALDAVDTRTFYLDLDGDGAAGTPVQACELPEGAYATQEDCDDQDAGRVPGAEERCNDVDDDCDDVVDEGLVDDEAWLDRDGDGFGDPDEPVAECTPSVGAVNNSLDCDDSSAAAHPDAVEVLDAADNDCDGVVDTLPWTDASVVLEQDDDTCLGRTVAVAGTTLLSASYCGSDREVPGHVWVMDALTQQSGRVDEAVVLEGEYNMGVGHALVSLSDSRFAVGGKSADWTTGPPTDGAVYVVDLPQSEDAHLVDVATAVMRGTSNSDAFGGGLLVAHLTTDTEPDLLVTAAGHRGYDSSAFLYEGPHAGTYDLSDAEATFEGPTGEGMELYALADLEGVFGDGLPAVALGGYGANGYNGMVSIVAGPMRGTYHLRDDADVVLDGEDAEVFGAHLGSADLDGDGALDLLALSAATDTLHIFSGATLASGNAATQADAQLLDVAGIVSFHPIGDVVGDAGEELLISATGDGDGGRVFALPGGGIAGTAALDEVAITLVHGEGGEVFGHSMAVSERETGAALWVGAPGNTDEHQPGYVYGFDWAFQGRSRPPDAGL